MQNYEALVERIAESAKIEKEEVERQIEAKKAKLSGLISKEGAAQIVAAELGVSFDNVQLKIKELMPGMKKVNLIGKVINLFPVREYNKNNRQGKIGSLIIADDTSNVRVVLWDTNHIELIEKKNIKENDFVEISNAMMKENELHLGGFSEIKKSDKIVENIKTERVMQKKEIKDLQQGEEVRVKGIVVQMFNPRFFSVCSECGKKVQEETEGFVCAEHGKVQCKERSLMNFVLDDGTETIRVVLFSDEINKIIPEEDLKDFEKLAVFREDFLGSEFYISGLVKRNNLFNNLELTGRSVEKINVDELIGELEGNN